MNGSDIELISVGIDIGTTTTHMVISRLVFRDKYSNSRNLKPEVIHKKILYESSIYETPLIGHEYIDAQRIREIIDYEYKKSGYKIEDIQTGALIITGEAAKKSNADEIVRELSEYAGNFVVAAAGPELEGILAGKGSGASGFSKEKRKTVINIDIGGGTANIAVFRNGQVIDTTCVNIGGRLVEIEPQSGIVTYVSKPAKVFIDFYDIDIISGKRLEKKSGDELITRMIEFLDDTVSVKPPVGPLKEILLYSGLKENYCADAIMFSGGVAEYIYNINQEENPFKYGDMGIMLGHYLRESSLVKKIPLIEPKETIRATVIGAGTQTVKISGRTVFIDKSILPYRNLPVVKVQLDGSKFDSEKVHKMLKSCLALSMEGCNNASFAISINYSGDINFEIIKNIASGICRSVDGMNLGKNTPLVIVLNRDLGKVLGQAIAMLTNGTRNVICIDSINVEEGDYIDVGSPLYDGDTVPVVLKTLVFNN